MGDCPSHLTLSRFKTDNLNPAEAKSVVTHLATCAACRSLSSSMDENIAQYEAIAESGLDALLHRLDAERVRKNSVIRRRAAFSIGIAAAAAAAAVLLVLSIGTKRPGGPTEDADVAFKGAFSMEVTGRRGADQFAVGQGARLLEGDAIRFTVTVDKPGYVAVFSREADGEVSSFYPDTSPTADPAPLFLDAAGRHTLPGSIVLDDALGKERFIAVFSAQPFDRAKAAAAVSTSEGTDGLGKQYIVQSIMVMKGE